MKSKFSRLVILVILALSFTANIAYTQGCSDAGFCTLNALKPTTQDSSLSTDENHFKTGIAYGKADHNINTIANFLEFGRRFNDKFSAELRLTSLYQQGNGIASFGLSDVYVTSSFVANAFSTAILGVKIPTNSANKRQGRVALPMDYQSSLGTFDVIVGFSYARQNTRLAIALQQPLTQNKNQFLASDASARLNQFQSTNSFERSADALIRGSYVALNRKRLVVTPGLLAIYHVANDRYTDLLGTTQEISGSKGLTLNATLFIDYTITSNNFLQISFGTPFVAREVRPDGLTRSLVISCEYRINF